MHVRVSEFEYNLFMTFMSNRQTTISIVQFTRGIRSLKMAQQQGKKVAGGVNLKVNKEWMKEKAAEQVGKYGATRTRVQAVEDDVEMEEEMSPEQALAAVRYLRNVGGSAGAMVKQAWQNVNQ